ncbi:MAG: hypothetical protein ACSHWY_10815 [Octadecabacter sp.]
MIRLAALMLVAFPVHAAEFEFCWIGNDGFALSGRMTVTDSSLTQALVTETDVTAFSIAGTRSGVPIGSWSLNDITPSTSWNLNFDPTAMAFVTGGYSDSPQGQQWNARGSVNDCGEQGFGFNSGAGGQDVCVKNTYRTESIIDPATPFPVFPLGHGPACGAEPLLGALSQTNRNAS